MLERPFRRFTYVTAHSPTLPSFHLRHSSFYNSSKASPTSSGEPPMIYNGLYIDFIYAFHCSAHSPSFPSLHLRHDSFSNSSLALPTSQLILQPFRYFTYVTAHSPTLLSLLLRHRIFTYVTWRAAHAFRVPQFENP